MEIYLQWPDYDRCYNYSVLTRRSKTNTLGNKKKAVTHFNQNNKYKKRGLGLAIMHRGEAFGAASQGIDTAAVNLHTNWDGSVTILSSMAEVGMGAILCCKILFMKYLVLLKIGFVLV